MSTKLTTDELIVVYSTLKTFYDFEFEKYFEAFTERNKYDDNEDHDIVLYYAARWEAFKEVLSDIQETMDNAKKMINKKGIDL